MEQDKIGKFIANQRKELGMTQMEFAEKLGITNKAVSKWETGRCLPDAALFSDICLLLNCTINEFFAGERIPIEQIEKKTEENLISMAVECQRQSKKTDIIGYITVLLAIVCISINISVGGMWLEGSPVLSNFIVAFLFTITWGGYIRISRESEISQKVSAICSVLIFLSSASAFILEFWDISRHVIFWIALPCEMLFYGLRVILGWSQIYLISAILSLFSFIFVKNNLKKISQ